MKKFLFLFVSLVAFIVLQSQNPGDLDTEFGNNGIVQTDFTHNPDAPTSVFVLADGKIITVGTTWIDYSAYILVTRYDADGNLDTTYGSNGEALFRPYANGNNYAWESVLLDDESLIIAGHAFVNPKCNVILLKVNPNGSLDGTFGNGGVAQYTDSRSIVIKCCGVQADGKIVIGGYRDDDFCAIRFNADGSVDGSFADNGMYYNNEMGLNDSFVECLTIQEDGKIILAGWGIQSHTYNFYESVVARLDETGSLDLSFGNNGFIVFDVNNDLDTAHDVEVLTDGKILINGYYKISDENHLRYGIYLNRRNEDGSVDTSFGDNGFVKREFVEFAENYSEDMEIAEDGTIFCVGNTRTIGQKVLISSFLSNGDINVDFGTGGCVIMDFGNYQSDSKALTILPDGKLLIAGYVFDNDGSDLMLARFHSGITTFIENNEIEVLQAYPNPCTDYVIFKSQNSNTTACIYDIMGRLVMQRQLSLDGSLNVETLPKGRYYVELVNGEKILKSTFVK